MGADGAASDMDSPVAGPIPARRSRLITVVAVSVAIGITNQAYRTSHAVVGPDLMRDVGIDPGMLATLTSVYFLTSAIAMLPSGVLFDRFGTRTVIPALLVIAAAGAMVFATAPGAGGLVAGRALMGLGYGGIMMGCFVLVSRWCAADRFALLIGTVMGLSQTGNLLATTPMAALADAIGWRGAFVGMAAASTTLAVGFLLLVRDAPPGHPMLARQPESATTVARGVAEVVKNRRLWPIFAMAAVGYPSLITVLGLWGATYLHDVHGLDGIARGNVLFGMAAMLALGQFFYGYLCRLAGSTKWTNAGGIAVTIVAYLALALVSAPPLWLVAALFAVVGGAGGYTIQIVAHGRAFYPDHLIGRGMTTVNAFLMLGVAVVQAATGGLIELFEPVDRIAPEIAYRAMFGTLAAILAVALAAYLRAEDVP